ncbi:hypothetical protein JYU34_007871 [Plutella xylostella]|uniref:Uncharacterized protein n=1 Tax=Plutella xylostella TaxID=51655 RepID=A0ABQ7QRG1_PLUXY|nr:hypothetical protein JYU34_007871 [Plutella xylostella]
MQCYRVSPKLEPPESPGVAGGGAGGAGARRLELPAPPGREYRAPLPQPGLSVIQCMRPPPPPPPPPPHLQHRHLKPPVFEEPSSSIPDLGESSARDTMPYRLNNNVKC